MAEFPWWYRPRIQAFSPLSGSLSSNSSVQGCSGESQSQRRVAPMKYTLPITLCTYLEDIQYFHCASMQGVFNPPVPTDGGQQRLRLRRTAADSKHAVVTEQLPECQHLVAVLCKVTCDPGHSRPPAPAGPGQSLSACPWHLWSRYSPAGPAVRAGAGWP